MPNYYDLLGVSRNATAKEIKQAYKRKAKQYHPDTNKDDAQAQEKFKQVNRAYQTLSNPDQRAAYDRLGHRVFEEARAHGGNNSNAYGSGGFDFDLGDIFSFGMNSRRSGFGGGLGSIFEDLFTQAFTQIQVQVAIPFTLAALGGTVPLDVHGQKVTFKVPPGTRSGTTFRLRNQGPIIRDGQRADVLATVVVETPRNLTNKQKQLLEELQRTGL